MALRGSVVKPLMSATGEVSSSGPTTIYGQLVGFPGPKNQNQVIFLSGYGTILEQKIIGSQPQKSMSTFYHRSTTETRRAVMLQALERAQALKAQLRAKYGEFDIAKDLQELREERLTQLG